MSQTTYIHSPQQMPVFALVGNISSGKTKILEHLRKIAPMYLEHVHFFDTPAKEFMDKFYLHRETESVVIQTEIAFLNEYMKIAAKIKEAPEKIYVMEKSLAEMIEIFLPQLKCCPVLVAELCRLVERSEFSPLNIQYILIDSTVQSCYGNMSDDKKLEITADYLAKLADSYAKIGEKLKIAHTVPQGTAPNVAAVSILEFISGQKIGYVPQIYVVAGNIAAGKTSVISSLKEQNDYKSKHYLIHIFLEDIEAWEPYLKKFYTAPKKNWFDLQHRIITHYMDVEKKIEAACKRHSNVPVYLIVERSPRDILEVFVLPMEGKVDAAEFSIIKLNYERLCSRPIWKHAKTILLTATPEKCFERCKKRNRNSEKTLKPKYLASIGDRHQTLSRHLEIDTSERTVPEIVNEIREWIIRD